MMSFRTDTYPKSLPSFIDSIINSGLPELLPYVNQTLFNLPMLSTCFWYTRSWRQPQTL